MELRLVLRVLGIKGKMRAPVKDKRALALQAMQQQNLGDADLEIMPHSTGAREADFSANDVARLFHVLSDPANGDALRRAYQPLPRTELDKERVSLWTSVVGPMFNRASYRPTPPALIDGIMETDLRVIDPNRHSGARLRSKLEGHFRTLRLLYTVAVANYARSG
ncbi:hypothetical protein I4F81_008318 [Pyropia yezoensis]|uniref:Uncharacterized protein n=1 Tax=Pyropia yezoensis TaxID=2788 RepID=A0ACC3C6Q0_PYRYE|nr:hypothetical protein I4F81_008318 [Neopyropia yezoensis]